MCIVFIINVLLLLLIFLCWQLVALVSDVRNLTRQLLGDWVFNIIIQNIDKVSNEDVCYYVISICYSFSALFCFHFFHVISVPSHSPFIHSTHPQLTATLPSPYREEMAGIAHASGLPASEVTLYNIFYEVFTFCTSIIVQDTQGKLYHGRNLDFGLFLG